MRTQRVIMRTVPCIVAIASIASCTVGEPDRDVESDGDDPGVIDDITDLLERDGRAAAVDRDGDRVADSIEELMLRRYRPFYKFSDKDGGESYRPADPLAEIEHAQLKVMNANGTGTSDPLACGTPGDRHLAPAETLYQCRSDASFVVNPVKTGYCLNIDNDRYHGVSTDEARANATGLYGHVAPTTINGHDAYKIEYWQFFAFNNQDISILGFGSPGDHEGDWTSVQLWFDRELGRIVKIRYLIHGKEATFTIPPTAASCRDCMIAVAGSNFDPSPKNFFEDPAAYSDNQAEFYVDANGFKHVVVYIERGGHETWPGAWGFGEQKVRLLSFRVNPHDGRGVSYLVASPPDRLFNLGEVAAPLTRAGDIMLPFNGYWGCTNADQILIFGGSRRSPVGPALHCSWRWPDGTTVDGCEH